MPPARLHAAPPAAPHGQVNSFVHVEWDAREAMWKVSVPHGQRFSKQFLAGVEVWAAQMAQHGAVRGSGDAKLDWGFEAGLPIVLTCLSHSPQVGTISPAPPFGHPQASHPGAHQPSAPPPAVVSVAASGPASAFDFTSFLLPSVPPAVQHGLPSAVPPGELHQDTPASPGTTPSENEASDAQALRSAMLGDGCPEADDSFEEAGGYSSGLDSPTSEEEESCEEAAARPGIGEDEPQAGGSNTAFQPAPFAFSFDLPAAAAGKVAQGDQSALGGPPTSQFTVSTVPPTAEDKAVGKSVGTTVLRASGLQERLRISLQLERQVGPLASRAMTSMVMT